MAKEVQIQIGMRWNHPSVEVICRETERFLGWLTQFETTCLDAGERIPVHWNLPSYPFLETRTRNLDDLVLEIKTRIQNKKDIPISMGYSGGAHPLLTMSELEKECAWGITNPWNSGIRDTFKKRSHIIMPYSADLWRTGAIACYKKNEFSFIGINVHSKDQLYFDYCKTSHPDTRFFLYLPLTSRLVMQLKKDVKKVLEENNYILPFFFDCMYIEELVKIPFDFKPFTGIIELLMSKYSVRFTSFTNPALSVPGYGYPYSSDRRDILPNHPLWRQNADQIKQDRALSLKTTTNMKDILKTLSPLYTASWGGRKDSGIKERNMAKKPVFPPEDRINTADMQGHVTLSGNVFAVQFLEGKIRNFTYKRKKIITGEKMRSYICFSGIRYEFKTMNAFSIAGDRCRGLREIRQLRIDEDEPAGSQLTDYIFVEDFPYLVVTSKITYPVFPVNGYIEQFALFELPLFYFHTGGTLKTTTGPQRMLRKDQLVRLQIYSDDTSVTHSFKPEESAFSLTGNAFIFSKDSVPVIVGFPKGKGPDLQILNVKIAKHKKGLCFMINIGGSYFHVPASHYSRVTEVFSFFIGVCPSPDDSPHFLPSQVLHEIPGNTVYTM